MPKARHTMWALAWRRRIKMLRKILLSSILILAVGCGSKSIKNGVYEGVIEGLLGKESHKYIISNNKIVSAACILPLANDKEIAKELDEK